MLLIGFFNNSPHPVNVMVHSNPGLLAHISRIPSINYLIIIFDLILYNTAKLLPNEEY